MSPRLCRLLAVVPGLLFSFLLLTHAAAPPHPQSTRADSLGDPLPHGAVLRLGTLRFFQGESVAHLAFSHDGNTLFSIGGSSPLRAWDTATGKETLSPFGSHEHASGLALSPDGQLLAVLERDQIRVWNFHANRLLNQWTAGPDCSHLTFSPDCKTLAWFAGKSTVRLRDLATSKETTLTGPASMQVLSSLVLSPDGHFAAASYNAPATLVCLWNLRTGKRLRNYPEEQRTHLIGVAFGSDSSSLVISMADGHVHVFDTESIEEKSKFELGGGSYQGGMALSPDGKTVAVSVNNSEVRLLAFPSGKLVKQVPAAGGNVSTLAFRRDGKVLAIGRATGRIQLWSIPQDKYISPGEDHRVCFDARLTPDGQALVVARAGQIQRFSARTGAILTTIDLPKSDLAAARLSPDARWLATVNSEQRLQLFDTTRPGEPRELHNNAHGAVLAFTPDSRLLASATIAEPNVVTLYNPATGKAHLSLKNDTSVIDRVALLFSPDGRTLLAGHPNAHTLQRWELATGQRRGIARLPVGMGPVQSSEGQLEMMMLRVQILMANRMGGISTVNLRNQTQLRALVTPDNRHLALLRDGRLFQTSLATGKTVRAFEGNEGSLEALDFSPNGEWLAAAGEDRHLHLWDARSGRLRVRLPGHRAGITAVTFSPCGKKILTTGNDGTVLVWDLAEMLKPAPATTAAPPAIHPLETLWADLASDDAEKVETAIEQLQRTPDATVKLLAKRVRPVPPIAAALLNRLIADLDHDRREVRDGATRQLEALDELAAPALRKVEKTGSAEAQRRVAKLLADIERPTRTALEVRPVRAVEVLEALGTPAARKLLAELARGTAESRLTREAAASLERLQLRPGSEP